MINSPGQTKQQVPADGKKGYQEQQGEAIWTAVAWRY